MHGDWKILIWWTKRTHKATPSDINDNLCKGKKDLWIYASSDAMASMHCISPCEFWQDYVCIDLPHNLASNKDWSNIYIICIQVGDLLDLCGVQIMWCRFVLDNNLFINSDGCYALVDIIYIGRLKWNCGVSIYGTGGFFLSFFFFE